MKETKSAEPWVTKNKINFAFKKYCGKKYMEIDSVEDSTIINSVSTTTNATGGRHKGSTIIKQQHYKETFIATKNEITSLFKKEQEEYKKKVRLCQ